MSELRICPEDEPVLCPDDEPVLCPLEDPCPPEDEPVPAPACPWDECPWDDLLVFRLVYTAPSAAAAPSDTSGLSDI